MFIYLNVLLKKNSFKKLLLKLSSLKNKYKNMTLFITYFIFTKNSSFLKSEFIFYTELSQKMNSFFVLNSSFEKTSFPFILKLFILNSSFQKTNSFFFTLSHLKKTNPTQIFFKKI